MAERARLGYSWDQFGKTGSHAGHFVERDELEQSEQDQELSRDGAMTRRRGDVYALSVSPCVADGYRPEVSVGDSDRAAESSVVNRDGAEKERRRSEM